MTENKTRWFRNTLSGQVFEAEGDQAAIAGRDRDVVELAGPPESDGETHPELVGLRERLDLMAVPWSENADAEALKLLIETQATAWRTELAGKGVGNTSTWKPETLKRRIDELARAAE
jgi:hypothetical protein